MYVLNMLDYYKLVTKNNYVFSFLKGPLAIKWKQMLENKLNYYKQEEDKM